MRFMPDPFSIGEQPETRPFANAPPVAPCIRLWLSTCDLVTPIATRDQKPKEIKLRSMKAKSFAAVFALLVLGVVSCVQNAGATPPSCLVSNERTGLGSKSLQGAIDATSAGDTLVVKGTCLGNSVIGKNLTLRGVNTKPFGVATLDGGDFSGSVLGIGSLDAVAVSIDGLTVTHGAVAGITLGGLFSTRVELSNTTVADNGSGIGCQTLGCDVSLSDSTVSGNVGYGLIGSRSTYRLLRSTVTDNGALGIGLGRGNVFLTNSTVMGNGQGGISLFQASAEISASSVSGNDGAAFL
jgi:Periplasmic copper-binding protein (NosD)